MKNRLRKQKKLIMLALLLAFIQAQDAQLQIEKRADRPKPQEISYDPIQINRYYAISGSVDRFFVTKMGTGKQKDDRFEVSYPFEIESSYSGELIPKKLIEAGFQIVSLGYQTDLDNTKDLSVFLRKPKSSESAVVVIPASRLQGSEGKIFYQEFKGTLSPFGVVHSFTGTYFIDYDANALYFVNLNKVLKISLIQYSLGTEFGIVQDRTRLKVYLVGILQTNDSRQVKIFRIDNNENNQITLELSTQDLHTKELVPGDQLQDLHCVDGQIRMYFLDQECVKLSGYKTIIYQKKKLGNSVAVFANRLDRNTAIQFIAGSQQDNVIVSSTDADGPIYQVYRQSKLFATIRPPKGMDYLRFKAYNEGNDIVGILAPLNTEDSESSAQESYLEFLSIIDSQKEILHQYVYSLGTHDKDRLANLQLGDQIINNEFLVMWLSISQEQLSVQKLDRGTISGDFLIQLQADIELESFEVEAL